MNSSPPPPSSDPGPEVRRQLGATTRLWFRRSLRQLTFELEPGESVHLLAMAARNGSLGAGWVWVVGSIVFLGVLIGLDGVAGWSFLPALVAAWITTFAVERLLRRAGSPEPAAADVDFGLLVATDRRLLLLTRRGQLAGAVSFTEIRSVAPDEGGWLGAKRLTVVTSDRTLVLRLFSDVPKRTAAHALTELSDHVRRHLGPAAAGAPAPSRERPSAPPPGGELRAP